MTELSSTMLELLDAEASVASTLTQCATTSHQNMQQGPALMLQPRRMHQLKGAVMVELLSTMV
jgi:hypothetical protein